ncbi:MAG: alkyl hydroperoxide reductase [Candidatus Angelobacter sp. Gp1-AA117]|nr:MAG: alkyl hydroperoxide reductase [Candidatus Angelobacter sp. Gp1-AA117]
MNRNVVFVLAVVLGITGLLFAGKFLAPHRTPPAQAGSGNERLTAGDVKGSVAPDFELNLLRGKGKKMKLSDLRGKGVVLDFWATYCEPCKIEMPWFVDLQKKYASQGLQIVGVDIEDIDEKDVVEFTHKMGINYPILLGTEKVADLYGGLNGLPMTFFIDRSGKIIDRHLGLMGADVIEENIQKALQGGSSSAPSSQ